MSYVEIFQIVFLIVVVGVGLTSFIKAIRSNED